MTKLELAVTILSCIGTIVWAVIAVLSYLKNKNEKKNKPPCLEPMAALFTKVETP